jgi:hypothetical protein
VTTHAEWVLDQSADWWLKLDRARVHQQELAAILDEFRATDPYTLEPEATAAPDRIAYRLRVHAEMPRRAALVLGDAVHNIRSALDALAYEMAQKHIGSPLNDPQAKAPTFPCFKTPTEFDDFMRKRGRDLLYGDRERNALRRCQSFWIADTYQALASEQQTTEYADSFTWSWLNRLTHLDNIDKHRHLNLAAFWPDLFYWGSDEGDPTGWVPGNEGVTDGAILGHMVGPSATTTLHHEFVLALQDDPAHRPHDPPYSPTDCAVVVRDFASQVALTFNQIAIWLEQPDAFV